MIRVSHGWKKLKNIAATAIIAASSAVLVLNAVSPVLAAPVNTVPEAKISFTFDDGYRSNYTQAAPVLAKYGLSGTSYITTSCVGMTKAPNNCQADKNGSFMTWNEIKELQNKYGWEIGSHTVTHPYMASTAPEQPKRLTLDQIRYQLTQSKSALTAQGLNVKSYASPYGDYDMTVLAEVAKHYSSHRGFADTGYNAWPYNEYLTRVQQVQVPVSPATVKGYIDTAIREKKWLVLVFHDVQPRASNNIDDYEYSTANLESIAAYVKSKQTQMRSVNMSQAFVNDTTNILANGNFDKGIADGWTTDAPGVFTHSTGNNGSYPSHRNSIRFVANNTNSHLFSPRVPVNPYNRYMLKNYINVTKINSGEVAFYIDEYDAGGNWISGQYKTAENAVFVENLNFDYQPSSAYVNYAQLQIIVPGNSGATGYLDSIQWFVIASSPPPIRTNLLPNHTFDAGLSEGWTTDNAAAIAADSTNNGHTNHPIHSVKLSDSSSNNHLFSPKTSVSFSQNYDISAYINVKSQSQPLGFYIDEFDVNGNWVSGQYLADHFVSGGQTLNMQYIPSSSVVASASLQVIIPANSFTVAYFDNPLWYKGL